MKTLRRLLIAALLALGLSPAFAQAPPVVPALPDTPRLTSYTIAGTTCACAVNFALYGNANLADYQDWVEVFLNGVQVAYNDPTYGWTITSPTGALASIARPITDAVLTFTNVQTGTVEIVGASRPARLSQWSENQGVSARNLNVAFTGIVAQLREVWDKINDVSGRDLKSQPGNTVGLLPLPAACAGGWLGFDATGLNPVCRSGGAGSGNVIGPASSASGDLALWDNATGTVLEDAPLSANLLAFFQTPTSANLAAAVTDEKGSGPLVFGIGGTSGQVQYNNAGSFGGFTVSGDGTLNTSTGALTISKTGGVAFGSLATQSSITAAQCPAGTSSALGCVKPDGTTIANSSGAISVAYGTSSSTAAAGNDSRITGAAQLATADQTLSGGANLTTFNAGSSSFTVDCGKNPAQYLTNNSAITITAPAADGECILQIENGASAGTITWSGFSEGTNTGDALDTTNAHYFQVSITRLHAKSHYIITALQ